jgi:hypothetical protein
MLSICSISFSQCGQIGHSSRKANSIFLGLGFSLFMVLVLPRERYKRQFTLIRAPGGRSFFNNFLTPLQCEIKKLGVCGWGVAEGRGLRRLGIGDFCCTCVNSPVSARVGYGRRPRFPPEIRGFEWYPRPELNRDLRFRKPLLYPFELRGHSCRCAVFR